MRQLEICEFVCQEIDVLLAIWAGSCDDAVLVLRVILGGEHEFLDVLRNLDGVLNLYFG